MNRAYELHERLLTVDHIHLNYGDKKILRDIDFHVNNIVRPDIAQGQTIALLGPSGIGKTQLFRCLAGLQLPSQGMVSLNGDKTNVRAGQMGVVFQNYPLLNHRTIWGNLKLAASKTKKTDDDIHKLLDRFGISDKRALYPSQLSGGQKQRVAIIQQMLCSEHFLLMDEPFSGLDVKMKNEVAKLIIEVSHINELNTTILTTHDVATAVSVADTVIVLGYQKDASGNRISGSTIIKTIDLIALDLAWQPDVNNHPNFIPTVREIEQIFLAS